MDRKAWIVGMPFWLGRIVARFSYLWRKFAYIFATLRTYLPSPLITPDQIKLLEKDNVVEGELPGLLELDIKGTTIASILPTYLRRFRPYQQKKRLRLKER